MLSLIVGSHEGQEQTYHVKTIPRSIAGNHIDLLVGVEPHNVLQSDLLVRLDTPTAAASARDDLEVDQMNVNRVCPASRAILQGPVLDGTTLGLGQNALLGTIGPGDAVDLPFTTLTLEFKLVLDGGVGRREWNIAELSRELVVLLLVGRRVSDDEAHNFVGVQVGSVVCHVLVTAEGDVAVLVRGEVNNHLPAFGHGDVKLSGINRVQEKTSIGSNDLEVNARTLFRLLLKVELERPADRGVQEAESIFAGFHL